MAKQQRKYDSKYKVQAVKPAKELGGAKAAAELGIPKNTMYVWNQPLLIISIYHGVWSSAWKSYTPDPKRGVSCKGCVYPPNLKSCTKSFV